MLYHTNLVVAPAPDVKANAYMYTRDICTLLTLTPGKSAMVAMACDGLAVQRRRPNAKGFPAFPADR